MGKSHCAKLSIAGNDKEKIVFGIGFGLDWANMPLENS